jgi:hypothetical protein
VWQNAEFLDVKAGDVYNKWVESISFLSGSSAPQVHQQQQQQQLAQRQSILCGGWAETLR